jgi:hypothetical protein
MKNLYSFDLPAAQIAAKKAALGQDVEVLAAAAEEVRMLTTKKFADIEKLKAARVKLDAAFLVYMTIFNELKGTNLPTRIEPFAEGLRSET